jgi:hypothetical protein
MHPKIKNRPKGMKISGSGVEPLLPHKATSLSTSLNPASRRSAGAVQPASGAANHARHHVSRQTQS